MTTTDTDDADTPFNVSRDRFEQVCSFLGGREASRLTHGELERRLSVDLRELVRLLYQDHVDLRAARERRLTEVVDVDGMAKTRPLANGIEIRPGKTIELKPGALRIVLLGLKEPFQLGQKIKGTLVFEKAGPIEIIYNIEENPGAAVSGVAGASAQHKHH